MPRTTMPRRCRSTTLTGVTISPFVNAWLTSVPLCDSTSISRAATEPLRPSIARADRRFGLVDGAWLINENDVAARLLQFLSAHDDERS